MLAAAGGYSSGMMLTSGKFLQIKLLTFFLFFFLLITK